MGWGAVQNMVSIWKSRGMSLGFKVRFLRVTAFPIASYGCESWVMTSGDKKRVGDSKCVVIEDGLGCHGRRGKRTNVCWRRLSLF